MKFRTKKDNEEEKKVNDETKEEAIDMSDIADFLNIHPNSNEQNEEIAKLNSEIESLKSQVDEFRDLLSRRIAEIDNIKRRHREETMKTWTDAEGSLITTLLPVLDNFERASEHVNRTEDSKKVIEGFLLTHDSLLKILDQKGLKKIEAKGKPFNYNLHDAIMRQTSNDVEPDTVLEEVMSGYTYKDNILRHTKVVISDLPEEVENNDNQVNDN